MNNHMDRKELAKVWLHEEEIKAVEHHAAFIKSVGISVDGL